MADDEANTFKFLITSDNHLGYMEQDPRRGRDSFVSFEECLKEAVSRKVDGVLLGGDLFDVHSPSLATITRTMTMMKRYVMGDAPIRFSLVSDPKVNFPRHPVQLANFQDPNVNIALPIFMIHGNHDDNMSGHSAVDLLASSSLVNYLGITDNVDEIVLKPVLLQKGTTRIALYGLGSIRDDRLHRAFRYKKVRFIRPKDNAGWFTILLFHQNRGIRSSFNKSGIEESMLKGFGIDLVIWGNEHEQRMAPESAEKDSRYDIVQPGSTILTSLSASESNPKQFGILEVRGTAFRVTGYPLQSCRPVVRRTVELWRDNPNGRSVHAVEDYIRKVIYEMLDESNQLVQHIPQDVLDYHPNIKFPLLRLAIDFHDPDSSIGANYPIPNLNRLGNQFINDVANPGNMLQEIKDKHKVRRIQHHVDLDAHQALVAAQNISTTDIRSKLAAVLATSAKDSCQLLSEFELGNAVYNFVEKGLKEQIDSTIAKLLLSSRTSVWKKVRTCIGAGAAAAAAAEAEGGAAGSLLSVGVGGATVIEPQAIVDLAFQNKKEVDKQFHDQHQKQNNRQRNTEDAVPDLIARAAAAAAVNPNLNNVADVDHDDVALMLGGGGGGANATSAGVGKGGVSAAIAGAAAAGGAKKAAAPKRSRAAAANGDDAPSQTARAPATRGRKKEVPAGNALAAAPPALNLQMGGGGGGDDDLLSMWTK